jgi:hypothetical protein
MPQVATQAVMQDVQHRPVPSLLVSVEFSKEDMMLRIVPLDGCA